VGRSEVVERLRTHPLYRALRADKLRIAALEATLNSYAREAASNEIPTHKMMGMPPDELKARTSAFVQSASGRLPENATIEVQESESLIGGGAAPTSRLPTTVISITHQTLNANQIEEALRRWSPPVISRIEGDRVLLDLRTVSEADETAIQAAITQVLASETE
jgi:L-seryl-tRNA(Ser) seleniumtransferase